MSFKATPKQTLALWYLIALYVADNEEPTKGDFRILRGAERKPLEEAGLIEYEKRPRPLKNNRKSYPEHIILTDKAWHWAENNDDIKFSDSKYGVQILANLLPKVVANLHKREIRLTEFLLLKTENAKELDRIFSEKTTDTNLLQEKICEAYSKISEGDYDVGVRLAELRQYLGDLPRANIDQALGAMELAKKLILMPINDPQAISLDDETAAIDVDGEKRHIIYMEG
ncbi:hypothetical protein QGP82_24525 [Leptothoe sp. LEGE 181152]|nr:hypothetical protein [Leptothoe sp. LEGE 181152]